MHSRPNIAELNPLAITFLAFCVLRQADLKKCQKHAVLDLCEMYDIRQKRVKVAEAEALKTKKS